MKAVGVLIGLGVLAAIGGVAYAASNKGVVLRKGEWYMWTDTRGFAPADIVAQYESLGFASIGVVQGADGLVIQGLWTLNDTAWEPPAGISKPQALGKLGA